MIKYCNSSNCYDFEMSLSTHFILIFKRLLKKYLIVYVAFYNKLLIIMCIRKTYPNN